MLIIDHVLEKLRRWKSHPGFLQNPGLEIGRWWKFSLFEDLNQGARRISSWPMDIIK